MGCTQCGDCCQYAALEVQPRAVPWLEAHGVTVTMDAGVPKVYFNEPCQFYDPTRRRCTAYEKRSEICRDYLCAKARRTSVITKEMLLERRMNLQANLHAIAGALEQIDWAIAQLEEDTVEVVELVKEGEAE